MIALILLAWLSLLALGAFVLRHELSGLWREPVLKRPVLIFESDDWGAGPASQARALTEILEVLLKHSDRAGRHPVMTLGLILATADGCDAASDPRYKPRGLWDSRFRPVLNAIQLGVDKGVFSLQLHGMEHFWPPALLSAAGNDRGVAEWLARSPDIGTERLPARLQSRWIDGSVLPSRPLDSAAIDAAVAEEVSAFGRLFGSAPAVAVPSTFIWCDPVERAWRRHGIRIVVTPGRRYESRDAAGRPSPSGREIFNGQRSGHGLLYVVRDVYFEPKRGHTSAAALAAFLAKTALARPTLFETHRENFLDPAGRERGLRELDALLSSALALHADLAFVSTETLGALIDQQDPAWIEQAIPVRLRVYLDRVWATTGGRKLLWLTLVVPLWRSWMRKRRLVGTTSGADAAAPRPGEML